MLDENVEKLDLAKSYFFQVIYREGQNGHAGTLELTPEGITFKVMTERPCELDLNTTEAKCKDFRNTFILKGLRCMKSRSSTISRNPHVGLLEIEFSVEHVIFLPTQSISGAVCEAVRVHSTTINSWIGHTTTQDNILEANYKNEDASQYANELFYDIGNDEAIGIGYRYSYTHSPLSYQNSFTFEPSLYYIVGIEKHQSAPYDIYIKIYNFLAFLAGYEPQVQHVALEYRSHGKIIDASLYFVGRSARFHHRGAYIFFPLGVNQRFNHWGLPPLPEVAFKEYFSQDSELPDIFDKYNAYRNMGNVEDRMLGYFRLLEKHCYKEKPHLEPEAFERFNTCSKKWMRENGYNRHEVKSFAGGLKRFNRSKYNTEKCVIDFIASLPDDIRSGVHLNNDDIPEICKLRNDITHANRYEISKEKIYSHTTSIHHLLIFALLLKLGVELQDVVHLTKRLGNS